MASKSTCGGVLRPLAGSFRYYPYTPGSVTSKEDMKQEVVRLGVEFSIYVAESMFLLCDDIHIMLEFCFKLWRGVIPYCNPVLERLLRVIHYVYVKDIKPKNGVYRDDGYSVQWELIRTTWEEFADGIIILHRLDMAVGEKFICFEDRLIPSAIAKFKQQVLKKLEYKLRSAKDVSEANGFARESIESNISDLWKSLFDEDSTSKEIRNGMHSDLFTPLLGKPVPREILALPTCSPYILGKDFAMQELKEEVVRLGVELSLYVAESMFLLCDDIRTMLWFCYRLWSGARRGVANERLVTDKLLLVMHYMYKKHIEPKNGVYANDGNTSVQWELVSTIREKLATGFMILNSVVVFREVGGRYSRKLTSFIEERVKQIEDKLWCAKGVSQVNGFARDEIESSILDLWTTIYDKEAKEATLTLKVIKKEILRDLFLPLRNEVLPH